MMVATKITVGITVGIKIYKSFFLKLICVTKWWSTANDDSIVYEVTDAVSTVQLIQQR